MTETARLKTIAIAASVLMVTAWIGTAAAAEITIGKVDLQELYRKSRRMQLAHHSVREIQLESNVKIAKLDQEIKEIEEKLKGPKDSLKPDERSELVAKLKAKRDDRKAEREAQQVKVDYKRRSIENALGPEVKKAIAEAAKTAGLKAVLPASVFAYSEGLVDITDKVIQIFDAGAEGQQPSGPQPSATQDKK
ncbi:MAG: OmpH family outer membrane protein [Desulfomonile sp.]|nr:OmpH family outer membrane protein [Desulfomonile sp.]